MSRCEDFPCFEDYDPDYGDPDYGDRDFADYGYDYPSDY